MIPNADDVLLYEYVDLVFDPEMKASPTHGINTMIRRRADLGDLWVENSSPPPPSIGATLLWFELKAYRPLLYEYELPVGRTRYVCMIPVYPAQERI